MPTTDDGVDVHGACDECGMSGGQLRKVRDGPDEFMVCAMCDDDR